MANNVIISIKKSQSTATPPSLANGELAYSFSSNTLFIGRTANSSVATTVERIGGKVVFDKLANVESTFSQYLQVANATETDTSALATWTELLATNTAIRTLVSDRMQVANTRALHTSITANLNSYIANTNPRITNILSSVSSTNTAIRTLVSDRMQVANVVSYTAKYLEVANSSSLGEVSNSYLIATPTFGDVSANSISITNDLTVNGNIILRGDTINIGDGGDIINLNASVNNHIIPASNVTYDLGSSTSAWRDLYLSGNTIHLGGVRLKEDSGNQFKVVKSSDEANVIFDTAIVANTSADSMLLNVDSTGGAVANLTAETTIQDAIKKLNEAVFNVQRNTFVRDVSFVADSTQGGVGTTVTLTLTITGNANEYVIDWGDGNSDTTIDATPSHTYTSNAGSPYTVKVTARNTEGEGSNSTANSERADYITIYTADPAVDFGFYNQLSGGTELTTLEANTGQVIYLQNDTANIANTDATATFAVDWGDGGAVEGIAGKTEEGGTDGARIDHTYSTDSGTGRFTVQLYCNSHSTSTPGIFPISNTALLKVFDTGISAPNNLTTKTISWSSSSSGTSPKLATGFVGNASGKSAGDSISSSFPRFTSGTKTTSSMSTFFHTTGSVSQLVNDSSTGTPITDDSGEDYYNLNASGSSVSAANRIYAPGLYETGTKARVSYDITSGDYGVNKVELSTTEGNSNELFYVYDSLTSSPTNDISSANVAHGSGSYNYISGIPYYNSGDTITVSGISVSNLTGQTYYNGNPITIGDTNVEGSSGTAISDQSYAYSTALASGDRSGNIPNANLSSVSVEDLTVNIGSGDRAVRLTVLSRNVNGTDQDTITSPIINVFNGSDVINESAISVSDSLGSGFDTDGVRITGFTGQTPSFSSSTDYYADNAWSGSETIAGTDEAVIRYGELTHNAVDYSSGYLPAGPDLATGRSGTQYFRFAFKRTAVSNLTVRLSGKVSGFHIAAPGTQIDDTSGSNGWLDASVQYAGSGIPGSGSGGNGSDGCAFTGGDRIIDGTTYSNQTFDLTLGTESSTNAYNNQILVVVTLNSDDSLTSLSVE